MEAPEYFNPNALCVQRPAFHPAWASQEFHSSLRRYADDTKKRLNAESVLRKFQNLLRESSPTRVESWNSSLLSDWEEKVLNDIRNTSPRRDPSTFDTQYSILENPLEPTVLARTWVVNPRNRREKIPQMLLEVIDQETGRPCLLTRSSYLPLRRSDYGVHLVDRIPDSLSQFGYVSLFDRNTMLWLVTQLQEPGMLSVAALDLSPLGEILLDVLMRQHSIDQEWGRAEIQILAIHRGPPAQNKENNEFVIPLQVEALWGTNYLGVTYLEAVHDVFGLLSVRACALQPRRGSR